MKPTAHKSGVGLYLFAICFVMLSPMALAAVRRATTAVEYIPQSASQHAYWQHISRERTQRESR